MVILKLGSSGPSVEEVQHLLNACGWKPTLVVDGDFGPLTQNAVRWFQAANNIQTNGTVGDQTLAALRAAQKSTPPTKGTIGEKAVAEAIRYALAGVWEKPWGKNRGGPQPGQPEMFSVTAIQRPWFPEAGEPWCAMFVARCLQAAGIAAGNLPKWPPLVSNWVPFARKKGWLVDFTKEAVQVGDIFIIGEVGDHIGFVRGVGGSKGSVTTVEGNATNAVRSLTRSLGSISHIIRIPG